MQNRKVFIIMGVSGCGKTTIGKMLAEKLSLEFHDADDFHSPRNIGKMKENIPLSDEDRIPWLKKLAEAIGGWNESRGAVLACSALKESYRKILTKDGHAEVLFIFLEGKKKLIFDRMKKRNGHYFPIELLDSQFDALEEPQNVIKGNIEQTPEEICSEILSNISQHDSQHNSQYDFIRNSKHNSTPKFCK